MMTLKLKRGPNHALQRTRPVRYSCNRGVSWAGSLSLGRWAIETAINHKSTARSMRCHHLMPCRALACERLSVKRSE